MAFVKTRRAYAATLALFLLALPASAQQTATFEDVFVPGPNSFENGANLTPPGSFVSGGSTFNNTFGSSGGFDFWSGWSVSNVIDSVTPGFGNQYAAFNPDGTGPGAGAGGSANYGVGYVQAPFETDPGFVPTVLLPEGSRPMSISVTNTTYAALAMRDGDAFTVPFGGPTGNTPDFFLLTITGLNAADLPTGTIDFYLADYRFADTADDYVVEDWTTIDLSTLGAGTTKLSFGLTSSDVGDFGINTPTYFAADNLMTTPVPEPAGVLVGVGGLLLLARRFRRAG